MLGRNTPLTQKVAGTEENPASKEHQVLQVLPDQLPCEERKNPKPASWKKTAVFIKEQVSARKLRMGLFAQASSHPSSWYFQDVIRGTFSTNTNARLAFVPRLMEMGTKRDHKLQQRGALKREERNLFMFRMQRTHPNTDAWHHPQTQGRSPTTLHGRRALLDPQTRSCVLSSQHGEQRVCFNVMVLSLFCEPAVQCSQHQI